MRHLLPFKTTCTRWLSQGYNRAYNNNKPFLADLATGSESELMISNVVDNFCNLLNYAITPRLIS